MSERMPVGDVVGPAATTNPWACPRCGHENKATWLQCPHCETTQDGLTASEREPQRSSFKGVGHYLNLLIGVLILLTLMIGAVIVVEPVWNWAVETWGDFIVWLDERL